jgi:hypothetical protein
VFKRIFLTEARDDSEFINAQFNAFQQEEIPVSGLSHSLNTSESLSEHMTKAASENKNGKKESAGTIKNVRNVLLGILGIGVISLLMNKYLNIGTQESRVQGSQNDKRNHTNQK